MESSGDDLDQEDDDLIDQQNDNLLDIDQTMNEQMENDTQTPKEDDIDSIDDKQTLEATETKKKSNKRGRRAVGVNMKEIEQQIMNDDNDERKRLLNLSKQLNMKRVLETKQLYDSDGSSYYKSSDDDMIENIHDMDRNMFNESDDDDDDNIAEEGVGRESFGNKKHDWYGADGSYHAFKDKTEREQYQALRDEENIGLQMQKDELKYQRENDFMDLEMEMMMRKQQEKELQKNNEYETIKKNKSKRNKKKKNTNESEKDIANKFSSWFNDNEEMEMDSNDKEKETEIEDIDEDDGKANVERIRKEIGGKHTKLIQRDHPELPGMLKELKEIVVEMKDVYDNRQKAIEKRFDDGIEDATLFVELLRTYSSTLAFYLQLKAKRIDTKKMKKHGIFAVLLKLKHRVKDFREIYKKSMEFMGNLPADWDRKEYLRQRKQLFEYEKQRQEELHERRAREEAMKRREESKLKRKERKKKKKEEDKKKKLFKKGFNRLNNEDVKLEGEDMRRGITKKIFKAQGLKRYRKKGIPRVKARIKFDRKMKLWKKKGFKTFKGKLPNGRMEYNINTRLTHSKRLT